MWSWTSARAPEYWGCWRAGPARRGFIRRARRHRRDCRRIAKANGLEGRIECLHGASIEIELLERVNVAIADQAGPFGIGGGLFTTFNDARQRFLKPHGKTIPSRIDLSIGLAEYPEGWAPIEFWDEPGSASI